MAAIEDVVVFLNYLQKCHRDLSQGATAQLLVMCNRTAVHNQLLQHGFQAAWFGGLRIATTSSAAGATARVAVVVQTGCGFLSGGRRGASLEDREDCFGRATVALTRAIRHTYIVSPIDMAGMIGMAQTHSRRHNGVDLVSGVSALLAWFPASWASKIAPCFLGKKVAPYNSRRKLPLFVPIESSKDCRGMRLTKCCRQSSSPTRMSLD